MKKLKCYKEFFIWVIGFLFAMCLFLGTTINPKGYIIVRGEKYYKCQTRYSIDTIESPDATIMIIKTQTILYDPFKCDGLK